MIKENENVNYREFVNHVLDYMHSDLHSRLEKSDNSYKNQRERVKRYNNIIKNYYYYYYALTIKLERAHKFIKSKTNSVNKSCLGLYDEFDKEQENVSIFNVKNNISDLIHKNNQIRLNKFQVELFLDYNYKFDNNFLIQSAIDNKLKDDIENIQEEVIDKYLVYKKEESNFTDINKKIKLKFWTYDIEHEEYKNYKIKDGLLHYECSDYKIAFVLEFSVDELGKNDNIYSYFYILKIEFKSNFIYISQNDYDILLNQRINLWMRNFYNIPNLFKSLNQKLNLYIQDINEIIKNYENTLVIFNPPKITNVDLSSTDYYEVSIAKKDEFYELGRLKDSNIFKLNKISKKTHELILLKSIKYVLIYNRYSSIKRMITCLNFDPDSKIGKKSKESRYFYKDIPLCYKTYELNKQIFYKDEINNYSLFLYFYIYYYEQIYNIYYKSTNLLLIHEEYETKLVFHCAFDRDYENLFEPCEIIVNNLRAVSTLNIKDIPISPIRSTSINTNQAFSFDIQFTIKLNIKLNDQIQQFLNKLHNSYGIELISLISCESRPSCVKILLTYHIYLDHNINCFGIIMTLMNYLIFQTQMNQINDNFRSLHQIIPYVKVTYEMPRESSEIIICLDYHIETLKLIANGIKTTPEMQQLKERYESMTDYAMEKILHKSLFSFLRRTLDKKLKLAQLQHLKSNYCSILRSGSNYSFWRMDYFPTYVKLILYKLYDDKYYRKIIYVDIIDNKNATNTYYIMSNYYLNFDLHLSIEEKSEFQNELLLISSILTEYAKK